MPKKKGRLPFPRKPEEPMRLSDDNWRNLESALGQQIEPTFRKKIQGLVNSVGLLARSEKSALSVVDAKKKIAGMSKKAEELRSQIWWSSSGPTPETLLGLQRKKGGFSGNSKEMNQKAIMNQFFAIVKWSDDDSEIPTLKLLAHALDALAATCHLAIRELANSKGEFHETFLFTGLGLILRREMKRFGLPYKIRKDVDKMVDAKERSPFIRFLYELQKILKLPIAEPDALASRILRMESKLHRGHGVSKI